MGRRVRVKVCGITRFEDAIDAIELGVDALGFIFFPDSPRYISADEAQKIVSELPPYVTTVGLFMDAERQFIEETLATIKLDLLQFHGTEDPGFCRQFGLPYMKALPMLEPIDLKAYAGLFFDSRGFLLDSTYLGGAGGSGKPFNWEEIPSLDKSVVIAGGLGPDNIIELIEKPVCYGIDVNSGVEASPGCKDRKKLEQLFTVIETKMGADDNSKNSVIPKKHPPETPTDAYGTDDAIAFDFSQEDMQVTLTNQDVAEEGEESFDDESTQMLSDDSLETMVDVMSPQYAAFKDRHRDDRAVKNDDVDVDEVATELNLAKAFIEIKHFDKARTSLETVVKKGDAKQRAEAQDMLNHIFDH